jgi:hypothetical protein
VTRHPHIDNNQAWYGLFENLDVHLTVLGGSITAKLYFPPCSPPETKCLCDIKQKRVFFIFIYLFNFKMLFARRVHIAIGLA